MAIAEAVPTRSDAVDVYEEETRSYERSPRDALRLAVFGLVTVLTLVLAWWLQDSVLGFEQSVIQLFNFLSPTVAAAVPAVFLFRLATFWSPILPGWLCFSWLRRREYI